MQKNLSNKDFPKMKRVRQKTNTYCGPAVLEMLASFIGKSINQNKLVKTCKFEKRIERHGVDVNDLGKATKIMLPNINFWYKENSTREDLDKIINKYEYPVGVEWQGVFEEYTDEDNGHYSIITHLDTSKNTILVSDPFRRFALTDRKFKLNFFLRRWWDTNDIRDKKTKKIIQVKDHHMMFILTKKDEVFPKELGMTKYS